MKILIDDTGCIFELDARGFRNDLYSNYWHNGAVVNRIIEQVLTPSQYNKFDNDTARVFTLSKKKEELLLKLIKKENEKK